MRHLWSLVVVAFASKRKEAGWVTIIWWVTHCLCNDARRLPDSDQTSALVLVLNLLHSRGCQKNSPARLQVSLMLVCFPPILDSGRQHRNTICSKKKNKTNLLWLERMYHYSVNQRKTFFFPLREALPKLSQRLQFSEIA